MAAHHDQQEHQQRAADEQQPAIDFEHAAIARPTDQPKLEQLVGVIKVMLDGYSAGNLDRVFVCYNDFVNTMTQRAAFDQLLPLTA